MESNAGTLETRSNKTALEREEVAALESLQFTDEIHCLMSAPATDNASSFTALLELPAPQAVQLIHSPDSAKLIAAPAPNVEDFKGGFHFPSNGGLIERAARFSVFAGEGNNKKSSDDTEKLPYVHVRARRGQATDSHSLAERARREKINARMKLLQELVPGCNKISGTALVLDEIINHVQSLQRQVEFLSMRLAAVNPRVDFNFDSVFTAESGFFMDSNFSGMVMPMMWPEIQLSATCLGERRSLQ
uniref:BHLH domain-containing protein n=1 Tax=Gossypium raimondii TaxID=29730 RepID=A0A0D2TSB3_GOSRA|nr:hypothetical protein B456_007G361700 [Gossypium raimondii]